MMPLVVVSQGIGGRGAGAWGVIIKTTVGNWGLFSTARWTCAQVLQGAGSLAVPIMVTMMAIFCVHDARCPSVAIKCWAVCMA